ncbi:MAG: OmpP1/FadL family transporter [bacterium]
MCLSCATLIISLSFITSIFANGVLRDCMGPVSSGRGATNIANTDDGTLIHDNPAAIARVEGGRIEGALNFLTLPSHYEDRDDSKRGKDTLFLMPTLAYIQEIDGYHIGVGVGTYITAGFSVEYRLMDPNRVENKYLSDGSLKKILIGAGWNVTDRLAVGMGIGPAYSKVQLELPYTFQTGPLWGTQSLVSMEGDDWSVAWNIGVQYAVSSRTTVGMAYVNQERFDIQGDMDVMVPSAGSAHYKVRSDFRWPQTLGAGITHRLKAGHRISLDMLWTDWSSAFNELTFKLSEGTGTIIDSQPEVSSTQDTFPLHWKDIYAFRLGYEHLLSPRQTLRFGYNYNENPVRSPTLTPLIPGIFQHSVSFGYGHTWGQWALNTAYYYSFKSRESVGTSQILGGDFDHSSVEISGHSFILGFQYVF